MSVKVGDIINEYHIELFENGNVKKEKEAHEVAAVKEHESRGQVIAIHDNYYGYNILQSIHEKSGINTTYNKTYVHERRWKFIKDSDSIYALIYTSETNEKKVYKKLKKEIEKYLQKEYGKYGNFIDLLDKIEI